MCVLVGVQVAFSTKMVLVVAMGARQGIAPVLKGHLLPARIPTDMLLRRLALYEFCNSAVFRCEVSHQQHELPILVAWQVLEGMRIDIQVIELGLQCDYDKLRRLQPQGQLVWNRFIRSYLNLQGHAPLVIQPDTTDDEHMLLQTLVSGVVRTGVVMPNARPWNLRQPQNQERSKIWPSCKLQDLSSPMVDHCGKLRGMMRHLLLR